MGGRKKSVVLRCEATRKWGKRVCAEEMRRQSWVELNEGGALRLRLSNCEAREEEGRYNGEEIWAERRRYEGTAGRWELEKTQHRCKWISISEIQMKWLSDWITHTLSLTLLALTLHDSLVHSQIESRMPQIEKLRFRASLFFLFFGCLWFGLEIWDKFSILRFEGLKRKRKNI